MDEGEGYPLVGVALWVGSRIESFGEGQSDVRWIFIG